MGLDLESGQAVVAEEPMTLTTKERQLLEWFLRHPGRLVGRVHLLDQRWSIDAESGEETVKTHLNNLRRKLRAAGCPDPLETIHWPVIAFSPSHVMALVAIGGAFGPAGPHGAATTA